MATTVDKAVPEQTPQATIFSRILVGIDESSESLEAARQAAILATGPVELLAVYDVTHALVGGVMPPGPVHYDEAPFREEAEEALEAARQELGAVEHTGKVGRGRSWEVLLEEIERERNTLVVVGSHGAGRAKGILIGSTATELVHKAPCSVLVARKPLKSFPTSIVVGVDGSEHSAAADAVAKELAERFDAKLERFESLAKPVDELVEAAMEADLLVIGSRGLHGIKALGSVSERVAHEAACSVLVVR